GVPQDVLKRLEATAPHHEPGREAMPQVVEVQAVELRLGDRVLERRADGACRPDAALVRARKSRQDYVDGLAHRNLPAPSGFRLRVSQPDHAATHVDLVPGQAE